MRASALASVQMTHCLPFRHRRWLFVRNGEIREFDKLRREGFATVAMGALAACPQENPMPHLAVARFWFEGNRYSPRPTTLADFQRRESRSCPAALRRH